MNFFGYVQLRRGILDHLIDGGLSNDEMLVLIVLIMLADKSTGRGTINAPTLRTFVPGLSYDAAKRVLHSLEEKHYIYRKIKHRSQIVYPFWVNRYIPSAGPHKGLQIDLAKVFESKDINDIAYVNRAPDDAPEGAPVGAPDPAPNYKNRELKTDTRNKSSISNSGESASVCAAFDNTEPSSAIAQAQLTVKGASALHGALPGAAVETGPREAQKHVNASVPHTQKTVHPDISRMSAEDYFKHIGKRLDGDWSGITANQLLSFNPANIPREMAWDAQMRWNTDLDAYVDIVKGSPVVLPDAIRRIARIQS